MKRGRCLACPPWVGLTQLLWSQEGVPARPGAQRLPRARATRTGSRAGGLHSGRAAGRPFAATCGFYAPISRGGASGPGSPPVPHRKRAPRESGRPRPPAPPGDRGPWRRATLSGCAAGHPSRASGCFVLLGGRGRSDQPAALSQSLLVRPDGQGRGRGRRPRWWWGAVSGKAAWGLTATATGHGGRRRLCPVWTLAREPASAEEEPSARRTGQAAPRPPQSPPGGLVSGAATEPCVGTARGPPLSGAQWPSAPPGDSRL